MSLENNITVLKIGGSAVTDKSDKSGFFKSDEMKRIAKEIAMSEDSLKNGLIIVHGAGSYGHTHAKEYGLDKAFDAEGIMITHDSVRKLNEFIVSELRNEGIKAIPLNPFAFSVCSDGRLTEMFTNQIKLMVKHGLVPVLHGDVCMDEKRGICILSGDQSLPYIAAVSGAKNVGLSSATDGVLDGHGKVIKEINSENFEYYKQFIGGSAGTDVTGGMLGKVKEMLMLAEDYKIESCIFNANTPGNIQKYLSGEELGTKISYK
ncbi:MAG: isopentenyl phosphate kinase family protein [Methanosarcinaceae archaeon]|nr:isopentenyl phosphate kinase family protein [Methanosarcinaceae archaeon]